MIETTLNTKCINTNFEEVFKEKGYAFFTKGKYNLNIIGVRHAGAKVTNKFDDYIVLIYTDGNGEKIRKIFKATTLPGKKAMNAPMNYKGTAILKEGQYRGAFILGKHKGQYQALCQYKPLPVYRDGNKNDVYDFSPVSIEDGIFGINIHKAGTNSVYVDGWSYGCQVFQNAQDYTSFMNIVKKSAALYGNKFTYTLLNERDL